ncbi:DUF4221 family protein [Algoriphagus aestuarii]|nr:DUF4221 family protein [Algoriphagus aestuarii]
MQKLLLIFSLFLFLSCGKSQESSNPENGNFLDNLTFSIDTVVVDPGDEIINLKHLGSTYVSLSPSKDQFYFFDRSRFILHEIDLNSLKLVNNYPFEEVGPNGTGRLVYIFKLLPNGNFSVQDLFGTVNFFSKTGKKIGSLNIIEEEILKDFPFGLNLVYQLQIDLVRNKLYSLPIYMNVEEVFFAVFDSLGQSGKILELPQFQKINNYKIQYSSGSEGGESRGEQRFLQQLNDLIIISTTYQNSVYIYDPEMETLIYKEFGHELVPLEKNVKVKNKVNSHMEFQAETDKLHDQINFYDFNWDEITQRFYRFASKGLPIANIDSPKKYEYFMFAYDKELNLKGEIKLEGLSELPLGGFFKDGKLWSYVNVEDELGFAVFTFDF